MTWLKYCKIFVVYQDVLKHKFKLALSCMDILITPNSSRPATGSASSSPEANHSLSFNDLLTRLIDEAKPHQAHTAPADPVILVGEITAESRTVSELLNQQKDLKASIWDIIHSEQNQNKAYTKIEPGTRIYYNSKEGMLTWSTTDPKSSLLEQPAASAHHHYPRAASAIEGARHSNSTVPEHVEPTTDLSEAVQQYLGTSYKEINCYELLVKGLQHMNIPYEGRDGLFAKLTHMALDKGMAPNAYLNGEGIVKAAGSLVLSKNYSGSGNWRDEAATLISEIEQLLDNGQILSFSTKTRGHTGIVSQKNNQWTFINSGRLDHSVDVNSVHRGVGEEILHEEIRNWFKLAHVKGENLSVTLGKLEQGKIRSALNMLESFSQRS